MIGFLLSLLLGAVHDRLGVGPASVGRAPAISVAASYLAGALWTVTFHAYRHEAPQLGTPRRVRHAPSDRAWSALEGALSAR